uniref:CSON010708 protein n=1 Tax=Culicoides sonorensis TaxID=179676 RepID=A0A336LL79_CULSO
MIKFQARKVNRQESGLQILINLTTDPQNGDAIVTIDLLESSQDSIEITDIPASPKESGRTSPPLLTKQTEECETKPPFDDVPTQCIKSGCDKPPKEDDQWEGEFCSNECAVKYCHETFKLWLNNQKNS